VRWGLTPGKLEGAGTPFNWPAAIGYGRQPFANVVAGDGALAAGPNGVQMGIFAWADPDSGQVSNVQMPGGLLGFVLPVIGLYNWQRCMPTPPGSLVRGLVLRAGMQCVMGAAGDFLTVFPFGGQAGQQVFTDPATGVPYSGNPGGLVPTPWTVMETGCRCNATLRISSFSAPLN
jgi:hypothetical protein